jgi:hypothetical protein
MKNLLVGLLALSSATAFAGSTNMVRFTNMTDANTSRSFDVSFDTTKEANGVEDAESANNHIALNYARAFGQFQAGLTFDNKATAAGDDQTIGLSGYYNMGADLLNTCYVAFHYDMMTANNDDKTNTMTLEYGHRWAVGSAWGLNLTFAPSVALSQAVTAYDADSKEDQTHTALAWNWAKFDVLF